MSAIDEISDPGEAIAEAVKEYLNKMSGTFSLAFVATKPDDTRKAFRVEDGGLRVIVTPTDDETGDRIDRGGRMHEFYRIAIGVVRQLDEEINRTRLSNLVRQINMALRGAAEPDEVPPRMAGHVWQNSQTIRKFDPSNVQEENMFRSVLQVTYQGIN